MRKRAWGDELEDRTLAVLAGNPDLFPNIHVKVTVKQSCCTYNFKVPMQTNRYSHKILKINKYFLKRNSKKQKLSSMKNCTEIDRETAQSVVRHLFS